VPVGDGPEPRRRLQQRFSPPDERIGTSEISISGDDERGFGDSASWLDTAA
jgi:hypothetical protein